MSQGTSSRGGRACCPRCLRPPDLCWCEGLGATDSVVPVLVLRHAAEASHPLNTARILDLGLHPCEVVDVPDRSVPEPRPLHAPWLLFPGEQARDPGELDPGEIGTLIVPDGTWRKTRAMVLGSPWLGNLPRVGLSNTGVSRYRLRHCSRAGALSTVEAVLSVLEYLDDRPGQYAALMRAFERMIERQATFTPCS